MAAIYRGFLLFSRVDELGMHPTMAIDYVKKGDVQIAACNLWLLGGDASKVIANCNFKI